MAIDHKSIQTFLSENPTRMKIAQTLRKAGFEISWTVQENPSLWGLYLKLSQPLRELFATSREVLVWVIEYEDFQARSVKQAQDIIDRNRPRLCEDFGLIVTGDPRTGECVDETAANLQTSFVGFSLDDISTFQPHGARELLRSLQERLFARDLYWLSAAVTSPSAFFGRKSLIAEISAELRRGKGHVGLFGLRKMGKTSVLFRLLESLRSDSSVLSAHVDVQRIDAVYPSADYFLWSLGQQLADSNSRVRRLSDLQMFGRRRMFSELQKDSHVPELFDHDIRTILKSTPYRLVFLIDEVELMSPEAPGSRWGDGFISAWRLLRGLAQESAGRVVFFLTGTNPRCTEASTLNGADNPIYNFFDRRFLPPLTKPESGELIAKLGKQMGLVWQEDATDRVFEYVGGHPFLLRAFASRVHRSLLPRSTQIVVTPQRVAYVREPFIVDLSSTLTQILEVLADQYRDEYVLLESLANGRVGEFRELAAQFPHDLAHLAGYGLVANGSDSQSVSIEILQSWIQRRSRRLDSGHSEGPQGVIPQGTVVEGYKIVSEIGHAGGFARVYKAQKQDEGRELFALKVLHNGSFSILQREIAVLEQLEHPNIVKVRDFGTLEDGSLYIAMELLEGKSLRSFCDRAARLRERELIQLGRGLLSALEYLHPNDEVSERLRTKPELTVDELDELFRASHGFIHRDIKPENVIFVEGRGPVLIDFNISVRVAAPVRTLKQTPGYLPPDGPGAAWTPDVDVFQLGLTLLQVGTGIEYDSGNLVDLRVASRAVLSAPMATFLEKMTSERRTDRFLNAREANHSLSRIPMAPC